jgi:hypothetical protein
VSDSVATQNAKHHGLFICSKTGVYIKDKCNIGKDLCPAHAEWLQDETGHVSKTGCLIEDYREFSGKELEFGLNDVVSIRSVIEYAEYINYDAEALRESYTNSVEFVRKTALFMKELDSFSFEHASCATCKDVLKNINHDCRSTKLLHLVETIKDYYSTIDTEKLPYYVLHVLFTKKQPVYSEIDNLFKELCNETGQ